MGKGVTEFDHCGFPVLRTVCEVHIFCWWYRYLSSHEPLLVSLISYRLYNTLLLFLLLLLCVFLWGFFLYSSTPCLFFNTKITVFVNYELMLFWITAALFTLHAAAYSTSSGPLYWLPFSLYPWNSATHSLNSSVPIIPWSLMPHYFKKRGWAWSPLKWADPSGGEVRVLRQHPESSTVGS